MAAMCLAEKTTRKLNRNLMHESCGRVNHIKGMSNYRRNLLKQPSGMIGPNRVKTAAGLNLGGKAAKREGEELCFV